MKNIRIKTTEMENFSCFIKPFTIDFDKNELVLVYGPNGSGKTSSIINSLMYTLYGVTTKGGRGSDVVNDITKKNCHTSVYFSVDNDEYDVHRYYLHSKHGNDVILTKNGNIIKRGHREVVPEIEKLLLPQKLITNILLFAQKVKAFFTDLTDSEQKEIFRKVLLLDDYVLYQKQATIENNNCNKKIEECRSEILIRERMIESNKQQIESLRTQEKNFYEKLKQEKIKLETDLEGSEISLKKYQMYIESEKFNNLESHEKSVDEKINKLNSLLYNIDNEINNSLNELDNKKNLKISELKSSADSKKMTIEKNTNILLNNERDDFNKRKEVIEKDVRGLEDSITELLFNEKSLNNNVNLLYKKIKEFKSDEIKELICPTCKQKVSGQSEELIKNHLIEIKNEIQESESKILKLKEEIRNKNKYKNSLNDELHSLVVIHEQEIEKIMNGKQKDLNDINNRLEIVIYKVNEQSNIMKDNILSKKGNKDEYTTELKYYENRKDEIKSLILEKTKTLNDISILENNIKILKDNIKKINDSKYDDSIIKECIKKEEILKSEFKQYNKLKTDIEKENNVIDFWKEGFSSSGIPSMLIDEAIPFMNERVSYYLDELSNGRYSVSFDTLKATKAGEFRDKISVNVFDNITHANSRVKLSGGQERLIDIATILTLSDLQSNIQDMKFNLLLFDEIFDSLDISNIDYVSRILRVISKKQNKSIFIISHTPIDQFECDSVLTF